jgi:hypothetical protein
MFTAASLSVTDPTGKRLKTLSKLGAKDDPIPAEALGVPPGVDGVRCGAGQRRHRDGTFRVAEDLSSTPSVPRPS